MDGGTQPRATLNKEIMEEYAELMRSGVKFPPLTLFFDGENYWLADGFHRLGGALRAAPDKPIEVEVIQGTLAEAQWYSFSANKSHGLRRSNEDKERTVRAALAHPNAASLSNVQIAEHCGVSDWTVRKYRQGMERASTSRVSKSNQMRTGRDGRKINTTRIGEHKKPSTTSMEIPKPRGPGSDITVALPPDSPNVAASILFDRFERPYIEALAEAISARLKIFAPDCCQSAS